MEVTKYYEANNSKESHTMSVGRQFKAGFNMVLRQLGGTVLIHKNYGAPNQTTAEERGLKNNEKNRPNNVLFQFSERIDIQPGDVLQQKGAADLWRVTEIEDTVQGEVYVHFEAKVEKIGAAPRFSRAGNVIVQDANYGGIQLNAAHGGVVQIFISHSSYDVDVVKALISLLRSALNLPAEQIRCTSVDGYRLPGGADTNAQLRREVNESTVFLGVISDSSISSLYVVFELGARWGNEKVFIPLLAPGTSSSVLGGPLAGINALRLDSEAQIHQLLSEIAGHLESKKEEPAVYMAQLNAFLAEAGRAQDAVVAKAVESAAELPARNHAGVSSLVEAPDHIIIPFGIASPYFATEPEGEKCVLGDCHVLVSAAEISSATAMIPILEEVARRKISLLIVAPAVTEDAMPTLIKNTQMGTVPACVVTPSSPAEARQAQRLVARRTSAVVFGDEAGLTLKSATLDLLGRATVVEALGSTTKIIP